MSIKFKSNIESEGKIIQSKHRAIKHTDTVQTLEVKVVTKTAAHPHYDPGNTNALGYTIDGVEGVYLELTPGIIYKFDQSHSSNSGHPLRFATAKDAAGSTAYTGSEVTTNGTPGSSGAYTQIAPTTTTPPILHYYCSSHGNMGSYAKFGTKSATDLTGFDTDDLAESSTNKYLTQTNLGQRSIGDLSDVNLTGVANNKILKYDSSASEFIIADDGGSSSSSLTIQDEGITSATAATTLDFRGSAVTVTGDNLATKTITISGTGGSSGQVTVQKNVATTSNATTTDFAISSTPDSKNNLQIYIDGVYQAKTAFEVSGTTVTLDAAPASGAVVEIIHFTVIDANIFLQSHTATSGQTSFNAGGLIATKNDTQVYIDGVYQNKGNYTISGSNVVLNPAPAAGAVVEIVNIKASAGSITWETQIQAANFNAAAGKGYFVNTTSGAVTVTLPAGSAGDEIHFTDYAGTFDTNKVILTTSDKIQGSTDDYKCITENATVRLIYQDSTKGWTADNISSDAAIIEYLVVAGGGGSSSNRGTGGGGAGGLRTAFGSTSGGGASAETAPLLATSTNYTVTVGAGGAAASAGTAAGSNGANSVFSTITSTGGGGGPSGGSVGGNNGGSGSGGGSASITKHTPGAGTSGQGYAGGVYYAAGANDEAGGGGGGAGAAGSDGYASGGNSWGGAGGVGLAVNIITPANGNTASVGEVNSSNLYFAGGGGGAFFDYNVSIPATRGGAGGLGGGGNGGGGPSSVTYNAEAGTANTGGGAGGVGANVNTGGFAGGSGVVILRYPSNFNLTAGAGLTQSTGSPFTESGSKISVFTAGTGTVSFS